MPVTRQQAQLLLSASEMELYDESRANPLRKLDAAALQKRVERIRQSRERARDLVQQQKLASRASTGSKFGHSGAANQRSKDKAALVDDILKRFEGALRTATGEPAPTVAKPAPSPTPPPRRAPRSKKPVARTLSRTGSGQAAGLAAGPQAKAPVRKPSARDVAAKKRIQAARADNRRQGKKAPSRERAPGSSRDLPDATEASFFETPRFRPAGSAGKAERPRSGQGQARPGQHDTRGRGGSGGSRRRGA
ncbi:hypothetical protein H1235_16070 [Pseudoxanthomonas sp. NC8]|nr:hypothetical protein H1235_16070 [Pseudoxanthomonas sp. NC8]